MTNPRVLIVDDEKNIRDLLEAGLKFVGFSVYSVANGTEAVAVADCDGTDYCLFCVTHGATLPHHTTKTRRAEHGAPRKRGRSAGN